MQFPYFTPLLIGGFIAICVAVPLAAWKLIEVAIWFFSHVHFSF